MDEPCGEKERCIEMHWTVLALFGVGKSDADELADQLDRLTLPVSSCERKYVQYRFLE